MSAPRIPVPFPHVFTTADLSGSGLSTGALLGWRARQEVVELSPGVYVVASAESLDVKRQVFASRAIATGQRPLTVQGAAVWHGIDMPPSSRTWWVADDRHRVVPAEHVRRIGVLLVPSPAWTAVQLARTQVAEAALVPLDSALRRGVQRGALATCAAELANCRGMRGVQAAIAAADAASETALESLSRGLIVQAGLPRPLLQFEFDTQRGAYRVDFWWPEFGLIGEADGRVKYLPESSGRWRGQPADRDALWREKRRQDALEALGFTVVRWTWDDVTVDREAWLRRLAAHFAKGVRRCA